MAVAPTQAKDIPPEVPYGECTIYLVTHNWTAFQLYFQDEPLHWTSYHSTIVKSNVVSILHGRLSPINSALRETSSGCHARLYSGIYTRVSNVKN